jgi:hypothetical protein
MHSQSRTFLCAVSLSGRASLDSGARHRAPPLRLNPTATQPHSPTAPQPNSPTARPPGRFSSAVMPDLLADSSPPFLTPLLSLAARLHSPKSAVLEPEIVPLTSTGSRASNAHPHTRAPPVTPSSAF